MPPVVKNDRRMPEWRLLDLSYDSAPKNLALEESLARTPHHEPCLPTIRVWSNNSTAVLGRFQEAPCEVDVDVCKSRNVQIIRRFSGGGAVFQDQGTLNFTIVTEPARELGAGKLHEIYSGLIMNTLRDLKLNCSFSPPNSILVDGRKVCGAAAAIGKGFALWHGSILVSTDIRLLEEVLAPSRRAVSTRFVRSQWKPVTTIEAALGGKIGMKEVKSHLLRSFAREVDGKLVEGVLTRSEEDHLQVLLSGKYSSAEWNLYGNRWGGK